VPEVEPEDVDKWLAGRATALSTSTLRKAQSALNRAMARDKVKRNVVMLCRLPEGQPGRPSKALSFAQALAVLSAAEGTDMHAYIPCSRAASTMMSADG
jgi:hypothetical protein